MWSVSSTLMIVHAVASRRIRSLANRAVERVIDQEKFHHTLATFLGKAQTGAHCHSFADLRSAGDGRTRVPRDFRSAVGPKTGLSSGVILGMPSSTRHIRQLPGALSFR
jgi:hypothetical protein